MKIDARQVSRILAQPGGLRAILLHGEDAGLIRERAAIAVRAVAGTLDDPFRVTTLSRDTHDRLAEEDGALSFGGSRRVVWVREAGDPLLAAVKQALAGPADSLLVLEAPGLLGRSRLKALMEAEPRAAAIACYPEEGAALEQSVRQMLGEAGVAIDADALAYVCGRLGSDRGAARSEVEKLMLYATGGSPEQPARIGLDDAIVCVGDAASAALDEAAFAATAGDRAGADLAIERCLGEGISPVAVARALLSHLSRLRLARLAMEQSGQSAQEAMRGVRPPVFFKRAGAFGRALELWTAERLMRAADETLALERAVKQTAAPDLVLCRRHLAWLAGSARAPAGRR